MQVGLIAGFAEQMQTLSIELFDEYWDDFVSTVSQNVRVQKQSLYCLQYMSTVPFLSAMNEICWQNISVKIAVYVALLSLSYGSI